MLVRVTADDYGLSRAVNQGIEALAADGRISAASVMVHPEAELRGISKLVRSGIQLGLHLTLVEEAPLVPVEELQPLLGGRQRLPPNYKALLTALARHPLHLKKIDREIKAQLARYRALGLPLDFVNSHQHVHLFPPIWRRLMRCLGAEMHCAIRLSTHGPRSFTSQGLLELSSWLSHALGPRPPGLKLWPLGIPWAGRATKHAIVETLRKARWPERADQRLELVMHPGEEDPPLLARYGHWDYDWRGEYELLASGSVSELLAAEGCQQEGGHEAHER
jgi:predicted glycoside hydrolase/deacetylase ChbG (UPF0249 family)